ncbi:E3 ubiquitin-protein ligase RNF138-like isoform X2 [Mixophyes fleayi]|uniref:E3 ubiquitin-protein ligase RNF138-like isoform X2 n=1 Tax=Mixophyes fleayi TaxID=3061075 RepID=UPI003F4DF85E
MAEATASTSCEKEDFSCPVCQEIFQTPVRTQSCQHVFCRKCLLMAVKASGAHCPLCRGALCRWERSTPTRASDIEMKMRSCSVGCMYCEKQVRLESTYNCPLCPQQSLDRRALLDHCNFLHYFEVMEAVCPICSSLPWGDPNQRTGNIVGHLNVRHRFNYEEYMNIYLDEEAQFRAAVEKSYQAFK